MIRALFASVLLAGLAGTAQAGSLDDPSVSVGSWSRGKVPLCDQASVLNTIAKRYHGAQVDTWKTGLAISNVRTINDTTVPAAAPGLIDRRFCHAKIELSNGRPADLFYLIEERQGVASIGWGVEFCVPGQDPWRIYDGECRSIRG